MSFYSKTLGEILDGNRDDLAGVSVPVSSSSLTMMLKVCTVHADRWTPDLTISMQVLVSGSVIATNKDDLLEVGQAAEALGIVLNDRQIGYKKTIKTPMAGTGVVKETGIVLNDRQIGYEKTNKTPMAGKGVVEETVQIFGKKGSYRKSRKSLDHVKEESVESRNLELVKMEHERIDRNKKVSCPDCKKYISNHNFTRHVRDHDKTPCPVCGKSLSDSNLFTHIRYVHKKIKVNCDICGKKLDRDYLKAHKKTVHKIVTK